MASNVAEAERCRDDALKRRRSTTRSTRNRTARRDTIIQTNCARVLARSAFRTGHTTRRGASRSRISRRLVFHVGHLWGLRRSRFGHTISVRSRLLVVAMQLRSRQCVPGRGTISPCSSTTTSSMASPGTPVCAMSVAMLSSAANASATVLCSLCTVPCRPLSGPRMHHAKVSSIRELDLLLRHSRFLCAPPIGARGTQKHDHSRQHVLDNRDALLARAETTPVRWISCRSMTAGMVSRIGLSPAVLERDRSTRLTNKPVPSPMPSTILDTGCRIGATWRVCRGFQRGRRNAQSWSRLRKRAGGAFRRRQLFQVQQTKGRTAVWNGQVQFLA